jgi:hypothetical protein
MDIQQAIFPAFRQNSRPGNQLYSKAASWFTIFLYFCISVFQVSWTYGLPYLQKARITVLHKSILLEMRDQMSIMSIALLPLTHAASLTR